MVRWASFGIENTDDRKFYANCGASLSSITKSRRKKEDECFGLPNSGAIAGIVFGLLIVIFGLSWVFGWEINYMAYFVVVFGVLIVAGAIYKLARKKK